MGQIIIGQEFSLPQRAKIEKAYQNVMNVLGSEVIEEVFDKCPNIDEVIFFGSRTRLHNTKDSDVDIILRPTEPFELSCDQITETLKTAYDILKDNTDVRIDLGLNLNEHEFSGYTIDGSNRIWDYYFHDSELGGYFSFRRQTPPMYCYLTSLSELFNKDEFINPKSA